MLLFYGSALASFCVKKFGTEKIKNLIQQEITPRVQEFVSKQLYNRELVELYKAKSLLF